MAANKCTLEALPLELQLMILHELPSIAVLHNLDKASAVYHEVYKTYYGEILHKVTFNEVYSRGIDLDGVSQLNVIEVTLKKSHFQASVQGSLHRYIEAAKTDEPFGMTIDDALALSSIVHIQGFLMEDSRDETLEPLYRHKDGVHVHFPTAVRATEIEFEGHPRFLYRSLVDGQYTCGLISTNSLTTLMDLMKRNSWTIQPDRSQQGYVMTTIRYTVEKVEWRYYNLKPLGEQAFVDVGGDETSQRWSDEEEDAELL